MAGRGPEDQCSLKAEFPQGLLGFARHIEEFSLGECYVWNMPGEGVEVETAAGGDCEDMGVERPQGNAPGRQMDVLPRIPEERVRELRVKAWRKALNTYDPTKGRKLASHFFDVYSGILSNEWRDTRKAQLDGVLIRDPEDLPEVEAARASPESVILAAYPDIPPDILDALTASERVFLAVRIAIYPKRATETVLAEAQEVTTSRTRQLRASLEQKLGPWLKARPRPNLPTRNYWGYTDLTPWNVFRLLLDPTAPIKRMLGDGLPQGNEVEHEDGKRVRGGRVWPELTGAEIKKRHGKVTTRVSMEEAQALTAGVRPYRSIPRTNPGAQSKELRGYFLFPNPAKSRL